MKNLLYKEFRLALHPTSILFTALSSLLLVPSYPYFIIFFYTCLGIFFLFLSGRENKDVFYTMLLPVQKSDLVRARVLTAVLLELLQVAAAVLFMLIRRALPYGNNDAGMNPTAAWFGFAFVLLGVFNFIFFKAHYKNVSKVGVPFLWGCVAFTASMLAIEAAVHAVPFFKMALNSFDPAFLPCRLIVLGCGMLLYALLTLAGTNQSVKRFCATDL